MGKKEIGKSRFIAIHNGKSEMNTHIVTKKSYKSEEKMPKENALWFKYRFDRNYIYINLDEEKIPDL